MSVTQVWRWGCDKCPDHIITETRFMPEGWGRFSFGEFGRSATDIYLCPTCAPAMAALFGPINGAQ